jgi:MCP family monocarboxylic acid transporter-like MFS transporter 10
LPVIQIKINNWNLDLQKHFWVRELGSYLFFSNLPPPPLLHIPMSAGVFRYSNNEVTGTVLAIREDQSGKLLYKVEKAAAVQPPVDDFPDGGLRAWLVVLGTMCGAFSTFGLATSWGAFQAYYEETILHDTPPSDIAWIGSLQFSLTLLPGLITGRLFDIGYFKLPLSIASMVLVASTFLVAECTKYWQFILVQGFASGLSAGIIFGPMMGIIGHWFKKRRGFVLGLGALGSALGGLSLPIIVRNLIIRIGFKWAIRSLAFILMATLGAANLLVERRLPPVNITGGLFNLAAFKSLPYSLYCLSTLFTFLGMYTSAFSFFFF